MPLRLLTALALLFLAAAARAGVGYTGLVVHVADGDSIAVLHQRKAVAVRLFGIDCPEIGQSYGLWAKRATSSLALGKNVTVLVKQEDRGTTVAEVILPDGRSLNRQLVRIGLAWWDRRGAPDDRDLKRLQAAARKARRGLWADRIPISPWQWRKRARGEAIGVPGTATR